MNEITFTTDIDGADVQITYMWSLANFPVIMRVEDSKTGKRIEVNTFEMYLKIHKAVKEYDSLRIAEKDHHKNYNDQFDLK